LKIISAQNRIQYSQTRNSGHLRTMTIADKLKYWFCLNSLLIASLYNSHPFGSRKGGRFAQVWLYLHYSVKRLKINVVHIKTDELVNILDRITFQPISPSWLDVCSTNDKVVLSIYNKIWNTKTTLRIQTWYFLARWRLKVTASTINLS
jgi:hypothetical protein